MNRRRCRSYAYGLRLGQRVTTPDGPGRITHIHAPIVGGGVVVTVWLDVAVGPVTRVEAVTT